ncbi:glycosyltransferase 87 family protein [Nocardioides iriomotensis]|uniref:DUF2029 domain-containing protein n=1 Tax=Nocardioides iriomotensis TaxID=715784 RepID=A0A4Q5J5P6_9ACTN|nr:glycosyltransferase 87 family protein [Nocardioides iriomotensis]RYU12805.1 DUF2029 domain-containing protein [Nocardioides iriomotensis]
MTGRGAAVLAVGWLASRAMVVWLLVGPQAWVGGDVGYFAASLQAAVDGGAGWDATLVEYPFPAVVVVAVPWLLATATGLGYGAVLLLLAAATDLAFTVLLAVTSRAHGTGWWPAVAWLVAVPAIGATAFARFDLLPGVLVGSAVLAVGSRPRLAAVLLAVATSVKLWPVVLAPPLLAATARRTAVGWYVGTGLVLAAATALVAGPARLLTPLTYQADRGLQIESVAATPVMLAWWLRPDAWTISYAPSKSFEVVGPAVGVVLSVTTLATVLYAVLVVAGTAALVSIWRRHRVVDAPTLVWSGLVGVLGFVVTGKVLSPQYLLWVLPLAVAGLVVADSPLLRQWVGWLLVAAALTQVVFPSGYGALTTGYGPPVAVPVLALAARNLLLAALLVVAVREAWRRVSAAGRSTATHRAR